MSIAQQKWDEALDGAQVYEPNERERLRRALDLAQELLREFPKPVSCVAAAFHSYQPEGRRLPLMVEAPFRDDREHAALQWDLSKQVLGPVFRATRVSMPATVVAPSGTRPSGAGLLYP